MTSARIAVLSPDAAAARVPDLADILLDCVGGGASVGFMADLSRERAEAFWRGVAAGVARDDRVLLLATDASGAALGTAQVVFAQPDNQPHRADVAKMLVRASARRRGIGAALMRAAEEAARDRGRALLVLDTVSGSDAARLYARLGWRQVGAIPDYALFPDGRLCATTVFYKPVPAISAAGDR